MVPGLADKAAFRAYLKPLRKIDWVVYARSCSLGRPKYCAIYRATPTRIAISNRRLLSADQKGVAFKYKDYRIEGPARYKTMTLATHEFILALPNPRAAEGLPPHPPLWAARQRQPSRKHCARSPAARRATAPKSTRDAQSSERRTPRAAASMSVLRRTHDCHRDLRARLPAKTPAHAGSGGDQDRHLMMPSPWIHYCRNARHSCWLSAGSAKAHIGSPHSPTVARQILSRYAQIASSYRRIRPCFAATRSRQPLQSNLSKPEPVAKSP